MSVEALSWVFKHSPYTGVERLIHLAIADVVNEGHQNRFWMSQQSLADKAKCGRQKVNTTIKKMMDDGYLILVQEGTRHSSNLYEFKLSPLTTPKSLDVVLDDTYQAPTPYIRKNNSNKTSSYTPEFEQLWSRYPRRENKKGTYRAYVATMNRDVDHETLLMAVENYAGKIQANGTDQKYTMLGATFFGPNERWQDFVPSSDPVWTPEGELLATARIYDEYFDQTDPEDDAPWERGYGPPKHPDGGLVTADGRRYRIDVAGSRVWMDS